jgi:SAM-dependent methyltransferase
VTFNYINPPAIVNLYQRLLGNPFIYNHVRPLAVGGLDMSPFYERIGANEDSIVLDVGCGTGDALRYLDGFRHYYGFDTDPIAIKFARERYGSRPRVEFDCRLCEAADVSRIQPTEIVLGGVLHHLPDDMAKSLLSLAAASPRLRRVVALDIVFLPGERISNWLARMDRGRFCRRAEQYVTLAESAGLQVVDAKVVRSHPRTGLAKYFMMTLEPRRSGG